MSRFGRYPLNIPSLTEAFANFQQNVSGSNQRRDRQDYDDRRFRDRDRDTRRDDEYGRRDSGGARGRSSRERFSPEVSFTLLLEKEFGKGVLIHRYLLQETPIIFCTRVRIIHTKTDQGSKHFSNPH